MEFLRLIMGKFYSLFLIILLILTIIILSVNAGYGSSKGRISINLGEDYKKGSLVTIFVSLINSTGKKINTHSFCNVTITHWNGSELVYDIRSKEMTNFGVGLYYYNWQIPKTADSGSYGVLVEADPNEIDTQATSGFHVAPWTEEIKYIWQKFQRFNESVIHNETLISATLSSTMNITLFYNVTMPLKEGFTTLDYLPMRWKFWFIDENGDCVDQSREQRFIEPYCNPLIAQVINLGNLTFTVNITIRPSLKVGNYTIVRELEVDPQQVWISYGHGPIGKITVLEDNTKPLINVSVGMEKGEKRDKGEKKESCIEILIPVITNSSTNENEKTNKEMKVIGHMEQPSKKGKNLIIGISLLVVVLVVIVYIKIYRNKKVIKNKK